MKPKAHYYMARLLLREIEAGAVIIGGVPYKIPKALRIAIVENKPAFLAGSVGPDVYPDMLVGELRIHSKGNINSGLWLAMMFEEFRNNYDYAAPEGREVLAFIAGWMMHYACDVFTHTFINHILGKNSGVDTKDPPASQEAWALHRAVEIYFEQKVAKEYLSGNIADAYLYAPYDFLKRFFLDDRRICFKSAGSWSDFFIKKPKEEQAAASSNASEKEESKSDKTVSQKEGVTPDDITMLDFSSDCLDMLFLLGGIRRALFYDENAPLEEQEQIGQKSNGKTDRTAALGRTDELTDSWLNMTGLFAGSYQLAETGDKNSLDTARKLFKHKLTVFEGELIKLLNECSAILSKDGLPQWLLDYLLKKNYLDMSELSGGLSGEQGPLKGEITIKIKGPATPLTRQVKKLTDDLIKNVIPQMIKAIHKRVEGIPSADDLESLLKSRWNKEEVDKYLENFGTESSTRWQKFVPFADALTLGKLCLAGVESFNKIVERVFKESPWYVKWQYDDPKKAKIKLLKPTTFPKTTKRIRFSVRIGDPEALEGCSILLENYDILTVEKQNSSGRLYLLLEKYYKYSDFRSVTLSVKTGSEDKFVIAVEAENLRFKEKWRDLVCVEGVLKPETSVSELSVDYQGLSEEADKAAPKIEYSDGTFCITLQLQFGNKANDKQQENKQEGEEKQKENKQEEHSELDFDINLLSFVKSLGAGREWTQLETDNAPYYFLLHKLMRLSSECYR